MPCGHSPSLACRPTGESADLKPSPSLVVTTRAEPIDVLNAPVTACKACRNARKGVKHHWFHECPGFDRWAIGRAEPASGVGHGAAAKRLPRWPGRCMALGAGGVEEAMEGAQNHLVGGVTGILIGNVNRTYILYRSSQAGRWVGYMPVAELEVAACYYLQKV